MDKIMIINTDKKMKLTLNTPINLLIMYELAVNY